MSTPDELGGAGGPGANPEELLAAGYAGCLLQALRLEGMKRGVEISGAEVTCIANLAGDSSRFTLDISLEISVPSLSNEEAQDLLAAACATWPYADGRDPHPPEVRLVSGTDASEAASHGTAARDSSVGRGYGG